MHLYALLQTGQESFAGNQAMCGADNIALAMCVADNIALSLGTDFTGYVARCAFGAKEVNERRDRPMLCENGTVKLC